MVTQEEKKLEVNAKTQVPIEEKKKKTGWGKFFSFLAYGGWLLIVILILAIVIAISVITGGK